MKIPTIFLTFVYWLSDIAAGVFMGALVLAAFIIQLPSDVLGAAGIVRVLDKLTPLSVAALVVLSASFVIVIAVERRSRSSFGWWVLWIVRSAAVVALAGITLYAAGELGSTKRRVLNAVAVQPLEPRPPQAVAAQSDSLREAVADTAGAAPVENTDPTSASLRSELDRAVAELRATFSYWFWPQVLLAATVFLVGAIRQSAWRHAWGERATVKTADTGEVPGDAVPPQPAGDEEPRI